MKLYLTETALALTAIALLTSPAAAETRVINGCEVEQSGTGNFFYKTDPGCVGTLGAFIRPSGEDGLNDRAKEREEAEGPGEEPNEPDPKA